MNLKIDPSTGEVAIENGQFVWLDDDDPNRIAQNIEQRIKSIMGDWYLDLRSGIPWFHGILGEKNTEPLAKKSIRRAILETPGVRSINTLEVVYNSSTRQYSVTFKALLEDNRVYDSTDYKPLIIEVK